MQPQAAFAMTPRQLVFVYEEMQREKALERMNFLHDTQVALSSMFSKQGAEAATKLAKQLEKFALDTR